MTSWALRLEPSDPSRVVRRLGPLRLRPGLEAAVDEQGATWVRGRAPAEEGLERALRATGAERFEVDAGGEVRRPGRRLAAGRLPRGPWRPLAALLAPEVQAARVTPEPGSRVALALARAAAAPDDVEGGALVVAREAFTAWALAAPQVRLAPLEVAAREGGRAEVVVRGRPLPPLPGERYVVEDGVAVPAGHVVAPALDGPTLRALLGLEPGDLALLFAGAGGLTAERVAASAFAPASRALARGLAGSR